MPCSHCLYLVVQANAGREYPVHGLPSDPGPAPVLVLVVVVVAVVGVFVLFSLVVSCGCEGVTLDISFLFHFAHWRLGTEKSEHMSPVGPKDSRAKTKQKVLLGGIEPPTFSL